MSSGFGNRIASALTLAAAVLVITGLLTAPSRPVDRVEAIADRLRCPACQSESVADSPSETAQAIKASIAEQVQSGKSDEEILAFFVARYGEWIMLDAPPAGITLSLWIFPPLALALGVLLAMTRKRRRRKPAGGTSIARNERAVSRE